MVWETFAILSWTGRALVCIYCTSPKTAPMAQITIPMYMRVTPLMPPSPSNLTFVRSGMLMSASLAEAFATPAANNIRFQNISFVLTIDLALLGLRRLLQEPLALCQEKSLRTFWGLHPSLTQVNRAAG